MWEIRIDDLSGPEVASLLSEHLEEMRRISPPESTHALDLTELKQASITFWCAWDESELVGCGALKQLDSDHAEIKSMRTANAHLRKGIAKRILQHLLNVARERGYRRVSLETGSMDFFEPARRLYSSFGFEFCEPFADYVADPNSVFMTKYF